MSRLLLSDFDYDLPSEFIAQSPLEPRDASRLLVLERRTGRIEHSQFHEIGNYLRAGDILVLNETRVLPARLYARKLPGWGKAELLLLRRIDPTTYEVLVGGKGLKVGRRLQIYTLEGETGELEAEIISELEGSRRIVQFNQPLDAWLERAGHVPLPPYIHTHLKDPERYQTVYARQPGSAAAPTAGLHFTSGLIATLTALGVRFAKITLHVGLDTFAPVKENHPEQHRIHTEWCQVTPQAAEAINQAHQSGCRVVAVGTTSVRTLESAVDPAHSTSLIHPYEGATDLFILPGYKFRVVDGMVTNFHLPRSTLLMLVSAFAGRECILHAYSIAKAEGYRFYSFGDAMLII